MEFSEQVKLEENDECGRINTNNEHAQCAKNAANRSCHNSTLHQIHYTSFVISGMPTA